MQIQKTHCTLHLICVIFVIVCSFPRAFPGLRDKGDCRAYNVSVSNAAGEQLERTLRDLAKVGTLVKDRGYRQVWRFEQDGKGYYLKFYPRGNYRDRWRRLFRGSPAAREFFRLQWLQ